MHRPRAGQPPALLRRGPAAPTAGGRPRRDACGRYSRRRQAGPCSPRVVPAPRVSPPGTEAGRAPRTGAGMNRTRRTPGDGLVNLGLGLLAATAALAGLLRLAGNLAARASGVAAPDVGGAAALHVLSDPLHPPPHSTRRGTRSSTGAWSRSCSPSRPPLAWGAVAAAGRPPRAIRPAPAGRSRHRQRNRPHRLVQGTSFTEPALFAPRSTRPSLPRSATCSGSPEAARCGPPWRTPSC